jgi:hypothetical protein
VAALAVAAVKFPVHLALAARGLRVRDLVAVKVTMTAEALLLLGVVAVAVQAKRETPIKVDTAAMARQVQLAVHR